MSTKILNNFIKKYPKPILQTKGFPYFYYKGNWEGRWVYHPRVIQKDKRYYLFYTGKSGINFLGNIKLQLRQDIGVAISNDLKQWKRKKNNPIISHSIAAEDWDSDLVAHADIIKVKNKYFMFYDGSKKGIWKESIGLAESTDLIHWKRSVNKPVLKCGSFWWDTHHVSRCSVIKGNDEYFYMFFAGHDGICERIGIARSNDLIHWDKFLKEPIIDLGVEGEWDDRFVSDPKVFKVRDYYLMTYTGYNRRNIKGCVGLAYSRDLISWEKFPLNPVLKNGNNGSWDEDEATRAAIVYANKNYYLFYTGVKNFFFQIGYAQIDIDKILKFIKRYEKKNI